MPFKSARQRRWMWANKPRLARKWTRKYGSKVGGRRRRRRKGRR